MERFPESETLSGPRSTVPGMGMVTLVGGGAAGASPLPASERAARNDSTTTNDFVRRTFILLSMARTSASLPVRGADRRTFFIDVLHQSRDVAVAEAQVRHYHLLVQIGRASCRERV